MSDFKPTLCIDFDGVIHSYEKGWRGGEIYGTVMPGFFEWAERAALFFKLVVYSSRSNHPELRSDMALWLHDRYREYRARNVREHGAPPDVVNFHITHEKPAAFLTIDDRCVLFGGNWKDGGLKPEALLGFKPWNAKPST